MDRWWNRLIGRLKGGGAGTFTADGPAGAVALVAPQPFEPRSLRLELSASGARKPATFWSRLLHRSDDGAVRPDPAAALERLLERVTQLCMLLEQQTAATPGVRVEQLREVVVSQCEQVRQLTTVLAGVPAALRTQGETLAAQRQSLESLLSHASGAREQHDEIRERLTTMDHSQQEVGKTMQSVARSVEQGTVQAQSQSQMLGQILSENRGQQVRMYETLRQHSRRATILAGFAVGLAASAAAFSAIGLYLRLTGH